MRKLTACLLIVLSLLILAVGIAETDRSITITADSNIVFLKKQLKLKAEVSNLADTAPSKTNIVWESDHPEIAKVNNGTVAGVAVGKATIKASARDNPDIKATFDVEVRVPVKTIKADPARIEMYVGENLKDEATLSVTVLPEDAYYKDVVMTSSNEEVATVDSNGKIKAVGPGKAKISVASTEPGSQAKADVSVTVKEYVDKILIEEKGVTVAEKKSKTIKAGIEPKTAANKKLKWVSADENIAKASNNGQITGVGCGTTTVTITTEDTGTVSETINVTVIKEIKKIEVDNARLVLQPNIDWEQKVTIIPEDATYQELAWKSSDEKIATVDSTGKITPIAVGKCTITGAAQDGYNAKVQVAVEVKNHDVVITEPGPFSVDFPTEDSETMAGMQVGNLFWGTIWKTTVKYATGCVKSEESGKLTPVKPGTDKVTVIEKENKKTLSKKKYTIFVAQSACTEENKEIINGTDTEKEKTTDDTNKKNIDADKTTTQKDRKQKFDLSKIDSSEIISKDIQMSREEIIGDGEIILDWQSFVVSVIAAVENINENNKEWKYLRLGCFIDDEFDWGHVEAIPMDGQFDTLTAFIGGSEEDPNVMLYNERVGLSAIDLINGTKEWTVGNDEYYMGDAAIHTVGKNTGIVYLAGTNGPDPIAISNTGSILWRSNIGLDNEITDIILTDQYIDVVYKNGYDAMLEYNGELIDVLTPNDH